MTGPNAGPCLSGLSTQAQSIAQLTAHCVLDTKLQRKTSRLTAEGRSKDDAVALLRPDVRAAAHLIGIDAADIHDAVCRSLLRLNGPTAERGPACPARAAPPEH